VDKESLVRCGRRNFDAAASKWRWSAQFEDKRYSRRMTTVKKCLRTGQTTRLHIEMSYTHLPSFIIRSMSSPTRSTNNRSLLLSASMIDGSASSWSSILLSASVGFGLDARKGEETWPSVTGREDKTDGIVKGSALGERVVVKGGGRVASGGRDGEEEDNLEERTVIETVRVDVSTEEKEEEKEK
jgi:hypothetical protein